MDKWIRMYKKRLRKETVNIHKKKNVIIIEENKMIKMIVCKTDYEAIYKSIELLKYYQMKEFGDF